jgi:drug/metabolite transporter (DMT)-like permease
VAATSSPSSSNGAASADVFAATILALAAAGLHAAWNLVAKRSTDRVSALSAQFIVGGLIGAVVLVVTRDLPAAAWGPAMVTGAVHVPYLLLLAAAYEHGDFSVAYPVARGSGAVLAALGGVALLDDDLSAVGVLAVLTVAAGMFLLAVGASADQLVTALAVGVTIGVYTVNDSRAVRSFGVTYPFAAFAAIGIAMSIYVVVTGRRARLAATMSDGWLQWTMTGAMAVLAYVLVMIAVRRAPVGYVAALRESSVLLAAFLGNRYLDEGAVHRRTFAAVVILAGLFLLVAAR